MLVFILISKKQWLYSAPTFFKLPIYENQVPSNMSDLVFLTSDGKYAWNPFMRPKRVSQDTSRLLQCYNKCTSSEFFESSIVTEDTR